MIKVGSKIQWIKAMDDPEEPKIGDTGRVTKIGGPILALVRWDHDGSVSIIGQDEEDQLWERI